MWSPRLQGPANGKSLRTRTPSPPRSLQPRIPPRVKRSSPPAIVRAAIGRLGRWFAIPIIILQRWAVSGRHFAKLT